MFNNLTKYFDNIVLHIWYNRSIRPLYRPTMVVAKKSNIEGYLTYTLVATQNNGGRH